MQPGLASLATQYTFSYLLTHKNRSPFGSVAGGLKAALRRRPIRVVAYIGINAYAYIIGSGETRVWFLPGLLTTLVLLAHPLIFGVVGEIAFYVKMEYDKVLQQKNRRLKCYNVSHKCSL